MNVRRSSSAFGTHRLRHLLLADPELLQQAARAVNKQAPSVEKGQKKKAMQLTKQVMLRRKQSWDIASSIYMHNDPHISHGSMSATIGLHPQ